jgi:hypothetical protein
MIFLQMFFEKINFTQKKMLYEKLAKLFTYDYLQLFAQTFSLIV